MSQVKEGTVPSPHVSCLMSHHMIETQVPCNHISLIRCPCGNHQSNETSITFQFLKSQRKKLEKTTLNTRIQQHEQTTKYFPFSFTCFMVNTDYALELIMSHTFFLFFQKDIKSLTSVFLFILSVKVTNTKNYFIFTCLLFSAAKQEQLPRHRSEPIHSN